MILGSKIAFILIQWRYFPIGLFYFLFFIFSFIANVRLIKSDETWFTFVQYRIKLSSAISLDLVQGYRRHLSTDYTNVFTIKC